MSQRQRPAAGGALRTPLRRSFYRENRYYDYAADVNVVLTYYKCLDDWEDERRLSRLLCAGFLKGRMKKLKVLYGRKIAETGRRLRLLQEVEQEGICDVDRTSGLFGEIMAEWFVYREDEWEKTLRHDGFVFFGNLFISWMLLRMWKRTWHMEGIIPLQRCVRRRALNRTAG